MICSTPKACSSVNPKGTDTQKDNSEYGYSYRDDLLHLSGQIILEKKKRYPLSMQWGKRLLFSIMFGHIDHACMHKLPMWISKVGLHSVQQRTSWEASMFLQLVKKFSIIYRAQGFITLFTKACHLSLPWVKLDLSTPFHPVSLIA